MERAPEEERRAQAAVRPRSERRVQMSMNVNDRQFSSVEKQYTDASSEQWMATLSWMRRDRDSATGRIGWEAVEV